MSRSDQDVLALIAQRVANGDPVDWGELTRANPEFAGSIQNLRNIQALGEACRETMESGARTPIDPLDSAPETWGKLRIIEQIGSGSFGEVYRAHDPLLQRDVALKLRRSLNEEEQVSYHRHLAEARHLARVHHPNVLPIHGVEIHGGRPGMWTEFIDGPPLEQVLETDGPLSTESILEVALKLSAALRAVHESDLVHGDIKTANVMRRKNGHLLLMDFGAGRDRPGPDADAGTTRSSGSHQGTPLAMAPELLRGDPPTVQSDLYALGVLLFRIASGRYPIEAESFTELIEKVEAGTRVPLAEIRPGLPESLVSSINRLLSPTVEERPQSAGEFETLLTIGLTLKSQDSSDLASDRLHGVPIASAPLIGRNTEVREIHSALDEQKVVTLVGPGGSGKSRLAGEMAHLLILRYPGGCWWVSLAALNADSSETNPSHVADEVVRSLGLRDRPGVSNVEMIQDHFSARTPLLLLDNAEHVQESCADFVAQLTRDCKNLHILVTSRAALGLASEAAIAIPPLPTPPSQIQGLEVNDYAAARLFIERAHASRPSYVFKAGDAAAIAQICRRLEGIPLAIELAAARIRSISAQEIADRLEQSLSLVMQHLTPGEGTFHKTLRASIEWSYRGLTATEGRALDRLAVFRGGWSLRAAESVCADVAGSDPTAASESTKLGDTEILDLLDGLVEKSLIVFEPGAGSTPDRYRMLEIIREFAFEKLEASGPVLKFQLRHLRYFRDLAEQGKVKLQGPEQTDWWILLGLEFDNFEQAIEFQATAPGTATDAMRLAASLTFFWDLRGMVTLGIRHAQSILARPEAQIVSDYRASLLTAVGILLHIHGQNEESIDIHLESQKISEATGGRRGVAASLSNMAMARSALGDLVGARSLVEQALIIMEELSDDMGIALTLNLLGGLDLREHRNDKAVERFRRSLSIQRNLGNHDGVALLSFNIGAVLHNLQRTEEAEELVVESLAIYRRVGNRIGAATSLSLLGHIELQRGEPGRTLKRAQEAIQILQEGENPARLCEVIDLVGSAAVGIGQGEWAARIHGAVERVRQDLDLPLSETQQEELEQRRQNIHKLIGDTAEARALAEGRAMNLVEATACALESPATDL